MSENFKVFSPGCFEGKQRLQAAWGVPGNFFGALNSLFFWFWSGFAWATTLGKCLCSNTLAARFPLALCYCIIDHLLSLVRKCIRMPPRLLIFLLQIFQFTTEARLYWLFQSVLAKIYSWKNWKLLCSVSKFPSELLRAPREKYAETQEVKSHEWSEAVTRDQLLLSAPECFILVLGL